MTTFSRFPGVSQQRNPRKVPLGTGEMDMAAILKRIKSYDENAVLTLEGTTGEYISQTVTTIKTIWECV